MACAWGLANSVYLKQIEKLIRTSARLVSNKRKYDSITDVINNELHWLGPKQLHQRSVLCLMYKILNCDYSPSFFKDLFVINAIVHSYKTRNANLLHKNSVKA